VFANWAANVECTSAIAASSRDCTSVVPPTGGLTGGEVGRSDNAVPGEGESEEKARDAGAPAGEPSRSEGALRATARLSIAASCSWVVASSASIAELSEEPASSVRGTVATGPLSLFLRFDFLTTAVEPLVSGFFEDCITTMRE